MRSTLASAAFLLTSVVTVSGQQAPDRQAYEEIDKRVFLRGPTGDPVDPITRVSKEERASARKTLRDIVTTTIHRTANANGATEEMVFQAISTVQIKQWWVPDPGKPVLPFVHISIDRGIPKMATAFAVYSGGFAIPEVSAFIQFYSRLGGGWNLVAETGKDFEDCFFYVAPLRSPVEGQDWYLAWGNVIGATRQRLKMRLYAFDGFSLRTVWSRDGLSGGRVKIENDGSVTLTYELLPPDGQLIPPTDIIERLRPTTKGLEP